MQLRMIEVHDMNAYMHKALKTLQVQYLHTQVPLELDYISLLHFEMLHFWTQTHKVCLCHIQNRMIPCTIFLF